MIRYKPLGESAESAMLAILTVDVMAYSVYLRCSDAMLMADGSDRSVADRYAF